MSDDKRYNGWTNYETWNVALWLGNDEGSYRYWRERADECLEATDEAEAMDERCVDARLKLADELKETCEMDNPLGDDASMWSDLLGAALSEVDWEEIAEHLVDEAQEAIVDSR